MPADPGSRERATVVVLGGTGNFGHRICRRLGREPDIDLVVTSRSAAKAHTFAGELKSAFPRAGIRAAGLDQSSADFERDLRALAPRVVVHTAGPYQGQDYRVARACIACGSHYVDLADSREFVSGFASLHEAALRGGVLLVSGASTLPGLSSAVVDRLKDGFREISRIEISIAPAHRTPRGRSTIAAVLSYCGKPFDVLVDGAWTRTFGWQDLQWQRYPSLGRRLSAACDVPDLVLLADYAGGAKTVRFHAALEAPWEQLSLWFMAWLTRSGIVEDWRGLAPSFARIGNLLIRCGSSSGGMHVRLTGIGGDGKPKTRAWYLTARSNHGPEIPCVPASILAKKLARNEIGRRGAQACLGLIDLSEFDEAVTGLDISWEIRD